MTTLNTIIEEEKKEFDEIALYSDGTIHMGGSRIDKLMTWFTTAMQRAYEAGVQKARAEWLRSEIEKLDNMLRDPSDYLDPRNVTQYNSPINSIITRYKEELEVLESNV